LFFAVISEHFSKNRMIMSVVAAKDMVSQKMYGFYWATLYVCMYIALVVAQRTTYLVEGGLKA